VLAAEHLLGFTGVDLRGQLIERTAEIVSNRFSRLGPLDEHMEVVEAASERLTQLAIFFEPATALHDFLRLDLILPEIGGGNALFDGGEFGFGAGGVKDGFAGPWRGAPDPRTCEADRPIARPTVSPGSLLIVLAPAATPAGRRR
jgi:hypothetical protein